jgi:Cu(I)/Ag(I) efflux system membrane fusion protein
MVDGPRRSLPFLLTGLAMLAVGFALGRGSVPPGEAPHAHAEDGTYTCAMHPQIRQPEPGTCPLCGMDLIPVQGGEAEAAPNVVILTERARALARIRTTPVRRLAAAGSAVRLLGRVEVDETTLQSITSWIGGRIDRLHVETTGAPIRRGQVVATLYSPEVYAAQQDLLTARTQLARLEDASELARSGARSTLEAARQRLRLLGIPSGELARMEEEDAPRRSVRIRSTGTGTVLERVAVQGAYVEAGAVLYRVADLRRLWVQLDAYEGDLAHLAVGQSVELGLEGLPGEVFEGRVEFLDPVVDVTRRTARVRISVANPDDRLRPGMFVEASVQGLAPETQPLVIPASAALFTGRRSVVYVERPGPGGPSYEARVVRLGRRAGDLYPVVAGLTAGERVVTEGAFALDADLQIRGGRSMMTVADDRGRPPFEEAPPAWRAGLSPVVEAYLALQVALAEDDLAAARTAAGLLEGATASFAPTSPEEAVERWEAIAGRLRPRAEAARSAGSLEALRGHFESISDGLVTLLETFGNPTESALRVAYCPMAFDDAGASWVQAADVVDNAYFGAAMRTCGDLRATVEPGAFLAAGGRGLR